MKMQLSDEIVERFIRSDKELNDLVNFIREHGRHDCSIDQRLMPNKDILFRYGLNYNNRSIVIWAMLEDYFKMKKNAQSEPGREIYT